MIGVIDSGCGGVNVILECIKNFKQNFVYLVDNKNCPYGNKSVDELKQIVLNNIDYLIKNYDVDFIILGCNTASSILDYNDYENIKCPIVKTIPDMKRICKPKDKSLLFATKNTIMYSKYVKYYLMNYNNVLTLKIKNLPKVIDDCFSQKSTQNNEKITKILENKLIFKKKLKNKYKNIKIIALGCTHFRHIEKEINMFFGNKIKFANCENNVAYISKFFIKKQTKDARVKIVLTKKDNALEQGLKNMFAGNLTILK